MSDIEIQAGNTLQSICTFKDFNGVKTDPTVVKIFIYNYKNEKTLEVTLGNENRLENGIYFYNLITEMKNTKTTLEWYGEINGLPSRQKFGILTKI